MKSLKVGVFFILLLFFLSSVYSIEVIDQNGDYVSFINKKNPTLDISVRSLSEPIYVRFANLSVDSNNFRYTNFHSDRIFESESKFTLKFTDFSSNIENLIDEDSQIFFSLYVEDENGDRVIGRQDVSPDIHFRFDIRAPEFLNVERNYDIDSTNSIISFVADERISKYELILGSEVIKSEEFTGLFLTDYRTSLDVDFSSITQEGFYNPILKITDLAGNSKSQEINLTFTGESLTLKLLTKEDDSTLNYHSDPQFTQLYSGKIFTKTNDVNLKIVTNKAATCYYKNDLGGFTPLVRTLTNLQEFTSENGIEHSLPITIPSSSNSIKALIGCISDFSEVDVAYLNNYLGFPSSLTTIEVYSGANLDITSVSPKSIITSTPFPLEIMTNEKAFCEYSISGSEPSVMSTSDYFSHIVASIDLSNGDYTLLYTCRDLLLNEVDLSSTLSIDTTSGIKVLEYSPKYFSSLPAKIDLLLSESPESCKFTIGEASENIALDYENLASADGTGDEYTITTSTLEPGENDIFVYCLRVNQEISSNKISVLYDSTGIVLSNFTFTKNSKAVEFLSSIEQISFEFEVKSLIPVEKYTVKVFRGTELITQKDITQTSSTLSANFTSATALSLQAFADQNTSSQTYSYPMKFDLAPPSLALIFEQGRGTITCLENTGSLCDNSSYRYGLSRTPINCIPNSIYNGSFDTDNFQYACAKVADNAGNIVEVTRQVSTGFEEPPEDDDRPSGVPGSRPLGNRTDVNETDDLDDNETDDLDNDDPFNPDPFVPLEDPDEGGGGGFLVVAAIILLFLVIGGTGYYAYSKGYLDDQLKKYGIAPRKKSSTLSQQAGSYYKGVMGKQNSQRKAPQTGQQSTYDSHLNKLKGFLNETLSKKKDVFDSFKGPERGKVDGYKDTLMKSSGSIKKESTGEFDEFYTSSTGRKLQDSGLSEAESFEEYHKKKKETNKKDSKK